jgi:hypothetical protein
VKFTFAPNIEKQQTFSWEKVVVYACFEPTVEYGFEIADQIPANEIYVDADMDGTPGKKWILGVIEPRAIQSKFPKVIYL